MFLYRKKISGRISLELSSLCLVSFFKANSTQEHAKQVFVLPNSFSHQAMLHEERLKVPNMAARCSRRSPEELEL